MKLIIEINKSQTTILVIDEVSPPQTIAKAGGKTLRQTVEWTVRRVNRIADQVEERLKELGFITQDEIEALLAKPFDGDDNEKAEIAP